MTKKIKTLFLIICASLFFVSGCNKEMSREEKAEAFVERALTAPDEKLSEIAASNTTIKEEEMKAAMDDLLGDFVSKETKENSSLIIYQELLVFQTMAAFSDKEFKVVDVKIKAHNDSNYSYTATVETNYSEDNVEITGNIQFDDDNYINYMTILIDPDPFLPE